MQNLRRYFRRAWLLHAYLIASFFFLPVQGLWAEVRQGSLDSNGFHDFDYDDLNDNQQYDEGEPLTYVNSDSDLLTDAQERTLGSDIYNPDSDYDGLTDSDEAVSLASAGWQSSPTDWDTDDDGYSDHDEFWGCYSVNYSTTPPYHSGWSYMDWDGDGTFNYQDAYPFDPQNATFTDSDGDGSYDGFDSDPWNSALWDDFNSNGTNDFEEQSQPSSDADNDGHEDASDSHPNNANLWSDWNDNGINDDQHSDSDGIPDESDSHPQNTVSVTGSTSCLMRQPDLGRGNLKQRDVSAAAGL